MPKLRTAVRVYQPSSTGLTQGMIPITHEEGEVSPSVQDRPLSNQTLSVTRNQCNLIKQVLAGYIPSLHLFLSFAVLQWDMCCIMASRSSLMEWSHMTIYAELKSI